MKRNAIRALICALALACAPGMALAAPGVCEGEVIAGASEAVYAPGSAQVVSVDALAGQLVEAGDALMTLAPVSVYAHSDGTVADVDCAQGDTINGAVLSVEPVSRYQIVCTVEDAYESPENMLLHVGQTIYAKCTRDGSHRAVAQVVSIDSDNFTLQTLGGELYVGETVYLYSSDDFDSEQRVGIGTVIANPVSEYSANGTLTRICVEPGDIVERGQLLYEYMPDALSGQDASATLTSDTSGIVLSISAQAGQSLTAGAAVAQIAPLDELRVSVYVSESDVADIAPGDTVSLTLPWQEAEDASDGIIESISRVDSSAAEQSDSQSALDASTTMSAGLDTGMGAMQSGIPDSQSGLASASTQSSGTVQAEDAEVLYEVRIIPQDLDQLRIGMTVTVDFNAE